MGLAQGALESLLIPTKWVCWSTPKVIADEYRVDCKRRRGY
jgi:hypothetical protein